MVYRIYVEKKQGLREEAASLTADIQSFLQIKSLKEIRLLNRYDVEKISEELFRHSINTVFSEPQQDDTAEVFEDDTAAAVFAVEYLPGQFDQRADSAAQCIQIISQSERPLVRTAKVYALYGELSEDEIAR
ncbi:MAG: phosphoribosylformylglycinamidine synthase, partial [Clostridia bacterium]|nr:phosphoribosylformylglycinamidine synthase [Clostridia bacterium]